MTRKSLSRWRWRLVGLAVAALTVTAGVTCVWPILSGRTEPPVTAKLDAQAALAETRRSGAARWASDSMRSAEASMRAALAAYRFEEVKLLPFRDYRGVRLALDVAQTKLERAMADGNRLRIDAKIDADDALAQASLEIARSTDVADAMHLGSYHRTLLQKSKIALAEARSSYDRGDFPAAEKRARQATDGSRLVTGKAVEAASRYADKSLVARWNRMVADTAAWSRSTGDKAIVVYKENHRLDLYDNGRIIRSYSADMGYRSVNDKLRSGDAATPEGRYRITAKKTFSQYYKALALNYPNDEDRARFAQLRKAGRIPKGASPGNFIEIHGEGGRGRDWTRGCVALSNRDMDDLFKRADVGTPVTIVGGDGHGTFARLVRDHGAATNGGSAVE